MSSAKAGLSLALEIQRQRPGQAIPSYPGRQTVALLARAIFFSMGLPYLPKQGEILVCDFDDVATGAEMIKRRPVIVVSRHDAHRSQLCTVVALSTTPPQIAKAWHYYMPHLRVAGWVADEGVWAKCDMLSTISLQRLNKSYVRHRSGRQYITHYLSDDDLKAVLAGIRALMQL